MAVVLSASCQNHEKRGTKKENPPIHTKTALLFPWVHLFLRGTFRAEHLRIFLPTRKSRKATKATSSGAWTRTGMARSTVGSCGTSSEPAGRPTSWRRAGLVGLVAGWAGVLRWRGPGVVFLFGGCFSSGPPSRKSWFAFGLPLEPQRKGTLKTRHTQNVFYHVIMYQPQ